MVRGFFISRELTEAFPGYSLLYALGYFDGVDAISREDVAARFTRPSANRQRGRGNVDMVVRMESWLIEHLSPSGTNSRIWRAARPDQASRFASLSVHMLPSQYVVDMEQLREDVNTTPNPWTGVIHVIGLGPAYMPGEHSLAPTLPEVWVPGTTQNDDGDPDDGTDSRLPPDLSEGNPSHLAEVEEYMGVYEVSYHEAREMIIEEHWLEIRTDGAH